MFSMLSYEFCWSSLAVPMQVCRSYQYSLTGIVAAVSMQLPVGFDLPPFVLLQANDYLIPLPKRSVGCNRWNTFTHSPIRTRSELHAL